jgi:hypothetical protein
MDDRDGVCDPFFDATATLIDSNPNNAGET